MSTLQVANIHLESTGNNRIQYAGSNNYILVAGGANVAVINTTAISFPSETSFNDLTITGNTTLTGPATFSDTVAVTGNVTFSNTVAVTGNVTFSNTVAVTGPATFSDTIAVTGNATFSNTITVTGDLTLGGAIEETVYTISGTTPALDPSNGTIQTHTLTGNTTYSDSLSDGEAITLMIEDGTDYTVTWPTMTWVNDGGTAPTLANTGYTVVTLWKASTTLYGALVGDGS